MDMALLFSCTILNLISVIYTKYPIVHTKLGTIRGVRSADGEVNMFMGIPYATVNESNPFGEAIPHPGFDIDTVFNANDDSSRCPQIEKFNNTLVGDFDCLHLNVYTPASTASTSRLPVFFWIYGGKFQSGFYGKYMYGPKFLVRHDVILVTVNYRVGPYGFMCLDIPEVPGNQGLKDTLMALRWLNKHIESFGGDPNRVTIGGSSSGAFLVDYHLLRNPHGEVLFHNAILQSGTTLMPVPGKTVRNMALTLVNYLGYETEDVHKALEFLITVPPDVLVKSVSDLEILMRPCIEKQFDGIEAFSTKNVITSTYHVGNISVMIGITNEEGRSLFEEYAWNGPDSVDELLELAIDNESGNLTEISTVKSFYFGDRESGIDTLSATINWLSDFIFVHPTYRCIKKLLQSNVKRLYFYMFTHDGKRNFAKYTLNYLGGGATHADEISYLFDMDFITDEPTPEDQLIIDKMTTMWTNFMKYGEPTPQFSLLLDVEWKPVSVKSPLHCMTIASDLSLIRKPFHDRMAFLDLFFEVNGGLSRWITRNT